MPMKVTTSTQGSGTDKWLCQKIVPENVDRMDQV